MTRWNLCIRALLPIAAVFGTVACANRGVDGEAPVARIPEAVDGRGAAQTEAEARATARPAVALSRQAHGAPMTEVVPDPAGRAALTLDADGGVRLWTDLRAPDVAVPLRLPVQDPVWMSLSRGEAGFVAGFIDTAGGGRIGRIEVDETGGRFVPLFEIPATEPLLELHVLAQSKGAARILALGVDHRVRVYDTRGRVRAELDRPGFVPWQLRVAQHEGAAPTVLAVLAGPTRVQRIALDGDGVQIVGDAHTVALDRGPNRNDLSLTPDGKTVLALMRRTPRSPRSELEAIDLTTGTRRIVAIDSDVKIRPRVHAMGGARVLLETGSGKGLALDLSTGVPWPPREGAADRDALTVATLAAMDLPGSGEDVRMHAAVAGGHRFVPTPDGLVVDPLGDGAARLLGREPFVATAVALSATGERVAWSTPDAIAIATLSGETVAHRVPAPKDGARLLAFVGDDRLVVLDDKGRATLHHIADGTAIATATMPVSWGIAAAGFRPSAGAAGGQLVLSSLDPGEPVAVLGVTASGFGEVEAVAKAERATWPEAGKPRNMGSREFLAAQGVPLEGLRLRPAKVLLAEPDPNGGKLALAQRTTRDDGFFDPVAEAWRDGAEHFVVTIVDRATHTRTWSVPATALADIAWSADGTRVAIASRSGAMVLDAATGESLLHERDGGVHARTPMKVVATAAR
jgi:hypothetical protein